MVIWRERLDESFSVSFSISKRGGPCPFSNQI